MLFATISLLGTTWARHQQRRIISSVRNPSLSLSLLVSFQHLHRTRTDNRVIRSILMPLTRRSIILMHPRVASGILFFGQHFSMLSKACLAYLQVRSIIFHHHRFCVTLAHIYSLKFVFHSEGSLPITLEWQIFLYLTDNLANLCIFDVCKITSLGNTSKMSHPDQHIIRSFVYFCVLNFNKIMGKFKV